MDTDAQAQAAIQGLNGRDHDGRNLTVNEAKPREDRGGGGGRRRRWRRSVAVVAATAAVAAVAAAVVTAAVAVGIDRLPS